MTEDDAGRARYLVRSESGSRSAQVYATLVLADAIKTAAWALAEALVTAARIRAGKPVVKCPHNMGEYRAEAIMDGRGNVIGYHYRCHGCHIILRTES